MDFFKKTWVKITSWVLLSICVVILILGGATTELISNGIALTAAIVAAVSALIAFITERVKK